MSALPELLPPWRAAIESDQPLSEQLQREVALANPMFGKQTVVLARRDDRDDVLFKVEGTFQPYAVVHLTWTKTRETSPLWPRTQYFESLEEWQRKRMRPDHEEYAADR